MKRTTCDWCGDIINVPDYADHAKHIIVCKDSMCGHNERVFRATYTDEFINHEQKDGQWIKNAIGWKPED